jgi:hypothetical protein
LGNEIVLFAAALRTFMGRTVLLLSGVERTRTDYEPHAPYTPLLLMHSDIPAVIIIIIIIIIIIVVVILIY